MKISNKFITAVSAVVTGFMFIVMKGEVINLAFAVFGTAFIVMGILDIVKSYAKSGAVKIICGIIAVVFGCFFVSISLYALSAVIIVYCLKNLVLSLKTDGYPMSTVQTLRTYAMPIIGLIAGVCLLFNQGGTVAWVFVLTGILFLAEGIIMLWESIR